MHKFKLKKLIFIIIIGIIVIFGTPIIINWGITYIDCRIGDDNSWLSFWGTWLGAIMSGIITFVGLKITINYNNKQQDENLRVNLRPYLNINLYIASKDDYEKSTNELSIDSDEVDTSYYDINDVTFVFAKMDISNIGLGSAIDIKLSMKDYSMIYKFDMIGYDDLLIALKAADVKTFYIQFTLPKSFTVEQLSLVINFSDIISQNKYEQTYTLIVSSDACLVYKTTAPKLIN